VGAGDHQEVVIAEVAGVVEAGAADVAQV